MLVSVDEYLRVHDDVHACTIKVLSSGVMANERNLFLPLYWYS